MGRRGSARRVSVVLLAVTGLTPGVVACGGNDGGAAAPTATTSSVAGSADTPPPPTTAAGPLALRAVLTGAAEIPGPGDGAGSGSATITVDPARTDICYELTVSGIAPADKAHVHRGPPDQAGPVVVTLTPPTEGTSRGCTAASPELVREFLTGPGAFYVNVHNGPFPAGAVRGQLAP